jgi:hypothetical protein
VLLPAVVSAGDRPAEAAGAVGEEKDRAVGGAEDAAHACRGGRELASVAAGHVLIEDVGPDGVVELDLQVLHIRHEVLGEKALSGSLWRSVFSAG